MLVLIWLVVSAEAVASPVLKFTLPSFSEEEFWPVWAEDVLELWVSAWFWLLIESVPGQSILSSGPLQPLPGVTVPGTIFVLELAITETSDYDWASPVVIVVTAGISSSAKAKGAITGLKASKKITQIVTACLKILKLIIFFINISFGLLEREDPSFQPSP